MSEQQRPPFPIEITPDMKIPYRNYLTLPQDSIKYKHSPVQSKDIYGKQPHELFSWLLSEEVLQPLGCWPFELRRGDDNKNPMNKIEKWLLDRIQIYPFLLSQSVELAQGSDSMMGSSWLEPELKSHVAFQFGMQHPTEKKFLQFIWPTYNNTQYNQHFLENMRTVPATQADSDRWLYSHLSFTRHYLEEKLKKAFKSDLSTVVFKSMTQAGFQVDDRLSTNGAGVKFFFPDTTLNFPIPTHMEGALYAHVMGRIHPTTPQGYFTKAEVTFTF